MAHATITDLYSGYCDMLGEACPTRTIDQLRAEFHARTPEGRYERDGKDFLASIFGDDWAIGFDLDAAAETLGYERIEWDSENDCYSGHGSSDPIDRSRDDHDVVFVAHDDHELAVILSRSTS